MNSFQILDSNNVPIPINDLDEQVAAFWNVPLHKKWYAAKSLHHQNWFDSIGFAISQQGNFTSGWNNVKITMLRDSLDFGVFDILMNKKSDVSIKAIVENYKDYFDLIDHWESIGYQPKQIKS